MTSRFEQITDGSVRRTSGILGASAGYCRCCGRWRDFTSELLIDGDVAGAARQAWHGSAARTLLPERASTEQESSTSAGASLRVAFGGRALPAKRISDRPSIDRFYRVAQGDTLLDVAGTAYAVPRGDQRISRAQLVNRHPYNWRLHRPSASQFNKTVFPEGIITFTPRFSCTNVDFREVDQFVRTGSCLPLIFLPPSTDIWKRPPPEMLQSDLSRCWATAIASWSMVMPGKRRFRSDADVIAHFERIRLSMNDRGNVTHHPMVRADGGLIRLPKASTDFRYADGRIETIFAGQSTVARLSEELNASFVRVTNTRGKLLSLDSIRRLLANSEGPMVALKHAPRRIGHATVVFGVSLQDGLVGEMDPFPETNPAGAAFGILNRRWLRNIAHFRKLGAAEAQEFYFIFRQKK